MAIRRFIDNTDFWAGVMFTFFGAAAVYMSRDYPMGSAMRMGPGYFPTYLGVLMMLLGLIIGIRGILGSGEKISKFVFRPILVLSAGVIIFGILMEMVGFVISLAVLIVLSTLAGKEFKWLEVLILTIVLIIGAILVFIKGIGLPYQLFWWY